MTIWPFEKQFHGLSEDFPRPRILEGNKQLFKDAHLQGIWMTASLSVDRNPGRLLTGSGPVIAYMQVRFLQPSVG